MCNLENNDYFPELSSALSSLQFGFTLHFLHECFVYCVSCTSYLVQSNVTRNG